MERFNTPLTNEAAKKLLSLDLDDKVITSVEKLDEWYTAWGGQCYVSFSGGKDSTVLAYLAAWYCKRARVQRPIEEPVEVKCLFYMPTRRRVDLTNLLESIDDVLVRAGVLKDDHSGIIVSHDGSRVLYDKDNPRTEVFISEMTNREK